MFIIPLTHEKWNLESRELTEKDKMWLSVEHTVKRGWWHTRKRAQQFFSGERFTCVAYCDGRLATKGAAGKQVKAVGRFAKDSTPNLEGFLE